MKIVTVLGTRPEIIRLSRVIPLLDKLCHHVVIHTGQNYTRNLNEIFFEELNLRKPDYLMECRSEILMLQVGKILSDCEEIFRREKPDRLLILGDTNSALAAFVAKRLGIPVFHMEAGNRCYDDRVPEEVNRRVIDHCSDILMPYTERSRANLLREGIHGEKIYVTGNPIKEVLDFYQNQIDGSKIIENLGLQSGKYFLVTLHRAENVDVKERLDKLIKSLHNLGNKYDMPVVTSVHPRTRARMEAYSQKFESDKMRPIDPPGLFDFVRLEKNAACVLTDSGTVQEECAIFRIPSVTLRDVTERPETLEAGSNIIAGCEPDAIAKAVETVLAEKPLWNPPAEYETPRVSTTAAKIILGNWKLETPQWI